VIVAKHVKWDVRQGGDGLTHVTRTQVERSTKTDGTKVTRIETDHTKFGVTRGR
jgi:hypothetical protein